MTQIAQSEPVADYHDFNFGEIEYSGDEISSEMLGANVVFTKDYLDDDSSFTNFVEDMGFTGLRFGGGTVVEEHLGPGGEYYDDFWDPDFDGNIDEDERITTPTEMFAFAAEQDMDIQFVLPTEAYLTDGEYGERIPDADLIDGLIGKVEAILTGTYGEVSIDIFEIGNEFWYQDDRMTASEYGMIVDEYATRLQELFDDLREQGAVPEDWEEPRIGAQVSLGWEPEDNEDILAELSMEAREAIDVVVTHFYPSFFENVKNSPGVFDRLDEWKDAEGFSELETYVSEYNVHAQGEGEYGLDQGSSVLEIFDFMAERGVDAASFWGTLYDRLPTRAGREVDDDEDGPGYELTPGGATLKLLINNVEGMRPVSVEETSEDYAIHAFSDGDDSILFLSSRTDEEIEVSFSDLAMLSIYDISDLAGTRISAVDDSGNPVTDPTSPLVFASMDDVEISEMLGGDGMISISLDAYEIVMIELYGSGLSEDTDLEDLDAHERMQVMLALDQPEIQELADDGKILMTEKGNTFWGTDGDDVIVMAEGSTARGVGGDNTFIGSDGDNVIYGGPGDNAIFAGDGDNRVWAGPGDDTIFAGNGNNVIGGGPGDARIIVGDGDNLIYGGGPGTNRITVGDGDNRVWGQRGETTITAGDGDNRLGGGHGDATITAGDGDNRLFGGPSGFNRITAGDGDNEIWAGQGEGSIVIAGDGNNRIGGGPGDATVTVGDGNNVVYGGPAQSSNGEVNVNIITAGDGDNVLWGGAGDSVITAGDGNNTIGGNTGTNVIEAGDGDNRLWGGVGDSVIIAGDGDKLVGGGDGDNKITAGDGDNTIWGNTGDSVIRTGNGNNDIRGGPGNNEIYTGTGNDIIRGMEGNDIIHSAGGDNRIYGGDGDNIIWAGPGDDIVTGNAGSDTFIFKAGDDTLTITDFTIGEDMLHLDPAIWGGDLSEEEIISEFAQIRDGDLILAFDDHTITLSGVDDMGGLSDDIVLI